MASASAGFALPQNIVNFSSAKTMPSGGQPPAQSPAIVFPRESFDDENLVVREPLSGSARLRWVSEDSEHRRPATRQRGFRGSSLEQRPPQFPEAGVPAEDGGLEIIRDAFQRAPA